jgi:S-formylglutathione hydrolase
MKARASAPLIHLRLAAAMSLENISCQKSFGGWHKRYRHRSEVLGCDMVFAVYLPPQAEQGGKLPVLYWLSGLTCTDENFMQKAGASAWPPSWADHRRAGHQPAWPDVPGDPDGAWDFGLGAGFYLNATQEPWARHYRMHDYVVQELPAWSKRISRRPTSAASAATPWAAMARWSVPCAIRGVTVGVGVFADQQSDGLPWGQKAFSRYLGEDRALARVGCLRADGRGREAAVAGGPGRSRRLPRQAAQARSAAAGGQGGHPLTLRLQPGYDHSYYFIASFIEDHLRHHAAPAQCKAGRITP